MTNDNRRANRYPTIADVKFDLCIKPTNIKYSGFFLAEEISGIGSVLNLSTTGLCFTTNQYIEPDTMLRCFLYMKKRDKLIKLRCEGPVVRTEESVEDWKVAITFTTLQW